MLFDQLYTGYLITHYYNILWLFGLHTFLHRDYVGTFLDNLDAACFKCLDISSKNQDKKANKIYFDICTFAMKDENQHGLSLFDLVCFQSCFIIIYLPFSHVYYVYRYRSVQTCKMISLFLVHFCYFFFLILFFFSILINVAIVALFVTLDG